MKIRRLSLFTKTARLTAAVSLLMLLILIIFVAAFYERAVDHHHKGHAGLINAVAQQIYLNPSPENIDAIAHNNGVILRYRGPNLSYTTDDGLPDFDEVKIRRRQRWRGVILARGGGRRVALHQSGEHRLMVNLQRGGPWEAAGGVILPLAAGLILLWGAFYFLQKRMLSPLSRLRDDMEAVGDGEWRRTEINQNDEIGELATVFNQMQQRLRALLQSKERFLADASHELRSPLARLRLAAEFVDDSKLRDNMLADIHELDGLTADILEKTRLSGFAGAIRKVPFGVRDIFGEMQKKYPRVRFMGDDVAATVCGDSSVLARALGNIIDNAQKFAAAVVVVRCTQTDGNVCIVVEDDGAGVDGEDLPHLFEPFYRADKSRSRDTGGFGLGLSIAQAAVVAHGGTISANNKTPHGLSVCIILPTQG